MVSRFLKTAAAVVVLVIILYVFLYIAYFVPSRHEKVTVNIPKGAGLRGIAQKLEEAHLIKNDDIFISYVMIKGLHKKLKAGAYEFEQDDSLADIVDKLIAGDVIMQRVTIPEGLTIREIADILDKNDIVSKQAFFRATTNRSLMRELLGDSPKSFEGYLFPDTYSYPKGVTPDEVIRTMVTKFKQVFEPMKGRMSSGSYSEEDIITIASIIEKETGIGSERPLISAVFHNRLKMGMKLDSDPTLIYGLGTRFNGNLRKEDLLSTNRYNTYRNPGLPPGPIANPGRQSIEAALSPAKVDYLYFVSKGDGTHQFSTTYKEHQQAVAKYQKKLNTTVE